MPMYRGSWCLRALIGKAMIFPRRSAITVCLVVRTPASMRAPAAANPDVNSAAKLKMITDRDSTGTIAMVR